MPKIVLCVKKFNNWTWADQRGRRGPIRFRCGVYLQEHHRPHRPDIIFWPVLLEWFYVHPVHCPWSYPIRPSRSLKSKWVTFGETKTSNSGRTTFPKQKRNSRYRIFIQLGVKFRNRIFWKWPMIWPTRILEFQNGHPYVCIFMCVPLCNHSKCENGPGLVFNKSSSNWIRYSKSVVGL